MTCDGRKTSIALGFRKIVHPKIQRTRLSLFVVIFVGDMCLFTVFCFVLSTMGLKLPLNHHLVGRCLRFFSNHPKSKSRIHGNVVYLLSYLPFKSTIHLTVNIAYIDPMGIWVSLLCLQVMAGNLKKMLREMGLSTNNQHS